MILVRVVASLLAALSCAAGLHAWWYEIPVAELRARGSATSSVRICATCPAKQERVGDRWRSR